MRWSSAITLLALLLSLWLPRIASVDSCDAASGECLARNEQASAQQLHAPVARVTQERDQLAAQLALLTQRQQRLLENEPLRQAHRSNGAAKYSRDDIACAIITTARYHSTRAAAAKQAWARFCGHTLYISATADAALPTTVIANSEEGKIINKKVFGAFDEMWRQFSTKKRAPRWYIKADDDTFMLLDNLVQLLERYDSSDSHYIGRAGEWRGIRYCGGGAGYVLSAGLLQRWAPLIAQCKRLPVGEDVSVGLCLHETLQVSPTWHAGFYHRSPSFFLNTPLGQRDHPEGLSPRPISFHSLSPDEQRTLSYLVYTLNAEPTSEWRDDPWPSSVATH